MALAKVESVNNHDANFYIHLICMLIRKSQQFSIFQIKQQTFGYIENAKEGQIYLILTTYLILAANVIVNNVEHPA